jgi:hypothetical protein
VPWWFILFSPQRLEGTKRKVTVQLCITAVVDVMARSVLCDEAIPKRPIWPEKGEIASPKKKLAMTWLSSYSEGKNVTTYPFYPEWC